MPYATSLSDYEIKHFFEAELGARQLPVARLVEEGM